MSDCSEYEKYRKYKFKYTRCKNVKEIIDVYPFHFIHVTSYENLIDILNDGILRIGKELPRKNIRLSGGVKESAEHIFASIYFDDLNNIARYPSFALILNPYLLVRQNAAFNKGWYGEIVEGTTILNPDDEELFKLSVEKIRNTLEEEIYAPIQLNLYGWMTHEIMFQQNIDLRSYLIKISCIDSTNQQIENISQLIKKNKYCTNIEIKSNIL